MCKTLSDILGRFWSAFTQKEILAAVIGAAVLISGYIYTTNQQQKLELLKMKEEAYSAFLDSIFMTDLATANKAMSRVAIYAPDCIIRQINDSLTYKNGSPQLDTAAIQKIKLVLHNDLHHPESCDPTRRLKPDDFAMFFPQATSTPVR